MGPQWRWGWRPGGPGRPPKERIIGVKPSRISFVPVDENGVAIAGEPIYIMPDELEALRLVYLENLTQEEAAKIMNISRGTLWRLLESGRRKVVQALIEKRAITIAMSK